MMASPKETGEGVDFLTQEHVTSSTGIGCAIIASGIPVYFIFVTEYPLKKPAPIRRFLGHRMHFGKNHLFSPSQHNNRVAEAVCGGDAAEKIGLKFSKDCTTWSRCTRWQIIPPFRVQLTFSGIPFLRRGVKIFPAFKVAFHQLMNGAQLIFNICRRTYQ